MIFKLGIKSLVRQPGKTISFFLLLLFVNLFLVLSVGMRVSSTRLLEQADENFLTIAELKYRGANYPDDTHYDDDLEGLLLGTDADELKKLPGVRDYEQYVRLRGYTGDYPSKADKYMLDRTAILFKVTADGRFMVQKNYNSYVDVVEGGFIYLNLEQFEQEGQYIELKANHYYIAYGDYERYYGNCVFTPRLFATSQMTLNASQRTQVYAFDWNRNYIIPRFFMSPDLYGRYNSDLPFSELAEQFYSNLVNWEISSKGPFIDVTKDIGMFSERMYDEEWIADQEDLWKRIANDEYLSSYDWRNMLYAVIKSSQVISNSVDVIMTDNLEYQPIFHQQSVPMTEGRYYEPSDGKNVCVVSSIYARNKQVGIGDTIHIDFHSAAEGDDFYNSYFFGSGFIGSGDYKIVGIYKYTDETVDTIYVPKQELEDNGSTLLSHPGMPTHSNTYTVGTFILDNADAQSFASSAKKVLSPRCEIIVYDQGYINVAAPLSSMQDTSLLLIYVCIFTGVCIILLYAYIFISKQKQTATTMLNLGTGGAKTLAYLMCGALILALFACLAGAVIGYFASDSVLTFAYRWAEKNSITDLTFSTLRTSLADKPFNLDFGTSISIVAITSAAVFAFSTAICAIFANSAIIIKNKKGGESFSTKLRRFNMTLRHARKSIVRTPARSMIVPTVSLAIIILISVFCGIMQSYTDNIAKLYDTVPVSGQFVTLNGVSNDNLLLEGEMLDTFVTKGFFSDIDYANSEMRYKVLGKYDKNGKLDGDADENLSAYFDLEIFYAKVFDRPKIVFTTSMNSAPEFFGSGVQTIKYDKGYSEDMFMTDEKVCVIPSRLSDIKLGDKIHVSCAMRDEYGFSFGYIDLTVAGITDDPTNKIYVPIEVLRSMNMVYEYRTRAYETKDEKDYPSLITGERDDAKESETVRDKKISELQNYSRLSSFSFRLKSGHEVERIKAYLNDEGYSYPSHIGEKRKCIVIDDSELQNSVNSLVKVRGYLEAMYPVMYVIIIAIAFVVSYLLIRTRVADIAVMRSMGFGTGRTFFVMFIEQFLLAVTGAAAGLIVMLIVTHSLTTMQIFSIALYVVCYAVGLIIAVCALNSVNVLKILSSKD